MEEEWKQVSTPNRARSLSSTLNEEEESNEKLTKQQLRNKRRSEKRKSKQTTQQQNKHNMVLNESTDDETYSEKSSDEERERYNEHFRRLRRLTKTLKQIETAREKNKDRTTSIEPELSAKLARQPQIEHEIQITRAALRIVEDAREARHVSRRAVSALIAKARQAEAQLLLSVKFDEKFACPICTEVIEAAVFVPRACDHAFCRSCLEDHVAKALKQLDCLCPLCRKPLCDPSSGRIEAKPAPARWRIKHASGRCHCGLDLPLYRLRDHLRSCGPKASLFPPRRKFGHEFRQPIFAAPSLGSPGSGSSRNNRGSLNSTPFRQRQEQQRRQDNYFERQEQLQLQAAILASMAESPSSILCDVDASCNCYS